MNALDLARWQFGVTTVYHFLFVPITIGITWFVAVFETLWYRRRDDDYLRLTRFFGKLMLINFAIGVVTGIVQEFQFGMNWSAYSRYVGDIFGAPLAMEALAAFFLESTFLGLWIFGWGRLLGAPAPRDHLRRRGRLDAQRVLHPGRQLLDAAPGRLRDQPRDGPRRDDVDRRGADATRRVLYAFPHTIGAAVMTAGMIVVGVSAWHLVRGSTTSRCSRARSGSRCRSCCVATLLTTLVGHAQAQLMTKQQPMKMAAAEALYTTRSGAPFSLFAVAPFEQRPDALDVRHHDPARAVDPRDATPGTARSRASTTSTASTRRSTAPASTRPIIGVTYWAFRLMTGIGFAARRVHGARRCCCCGAGRLRVVAPATCASRRARSRCRSSPTRPAGSSPRWAASPGSCRAC